MEKKTENEMETDDIYCLTLVILKVLGLFKTIHNIAPAGWGTKHGTPFWKLALWYVLTVPCHLDG